jgi:hypothetical protein
MSTLSVHFVVPSVSQLLCSTSFCLSVCLVCLSLLCLSLLLSLSLSHLISVPAAARLEAPFTFLSFHCLFGSGDHFWWQDSLCAPGCVHFHHRFVLLSLPSCILTYRHRMKIGIEASYAKPLLITTPPSSPSRSVFPVSGLVSARNTPATATAVFTYSPIHPSTHPPTHSRQQSSLSSSTLCTCTKKWHECNMLDKE